MITLKNTLGTVLFLLILLVIFFGFFAFRVSRQMTTPVPQGGQSHLGPIKPGLLGIGTPYHNCRGYLFLNRNPQNFLTDPVITLLDNNGIDLTISEVDDPANPDFWVKVPVGNPGFVRFEADGAYAIQSMIENNCFVSLHDAATFSGSVKGHVFVLQGEKLPDPTPLPQIRLLIETAKGWQSEITTDGSGKFQTFIPPGPFSVIVRSDNHADAYFNDLSAIAGETIDRQIILPAGCELEAFVIGDKVTLDGAKVSLVTSMEDDADAVAGERGVVKIKGLTQGMATAYVQHPGYQEKSFSLLIPGDKIGIRKPFLLMPSEDFTASVVFENQSRVPNAEIRVARNGKVIFDGLASTLSELDILASGQTYAFSARWNPDPGNPLAALHSSSKIWTMPNSGGGELKLELQDYVVARGLVLAADGSHLFGGTCVKIRPAEMELENVIDELTVWCQTSGHFESPPLPLGNYTLVAQHPHHGMVGKNIRLNKPGKANTGKFTLPE
ncbi:hypothetical protein CBD41_00985 [bacterium TMED181]|nr:hypothetical protein [Planctomycetota bacterium]OUW47413.1 MAG: hypothetical protein CBD41_00985 [bacterium TMED181]